MYSLLNFDNVIFTGKLAGMPTVFTRYANPDYVPSRFYESKFKSGQGARTQNVIYDVLRLYKGTFPGVHAYVAETDKGYAVELQQSGETWCALLLRRRNGALYIKAGIIDDNDIVRSFTLDNSTKKLILLGLMPKILEENEAHSIYDTMSNFLEWDPEGQDWLFNNHIEDFAKLLNRFCTNFEMRYTTAPSDNIVIDTDKISRLKIADLEVNIKQEFCGIAKRFFTNAPSPQIQLSSNSSQNFEGQYAYSQRDFTEEEKNMIARVPSGYIMPDFVPEICNYFTKSTSFPSPMRVAYLIGPAGTGKTEAANAIFSGLGLPGGHYTCNPATEIFDFIGQVFPNCSDHDISFDAIRSKLGLPNTEDIINDPESAYETVYGRKSDGFPDEGAIIVEMIERVMEAMAGSGNTGSFTYVESGLIRAVRLGYGFEIQEIGCVLRPGVAVGLNALLETGAHNYVTLPTGEMIKKHPDCTLIFTSNDEYEGCCNLNQSVLDRMSLVYRIENPSAEVMKQRIMERLKFPDTAILDRMIEVIYSISKASKEKGIEDGVCGYRALENWAMAAMIKSIDNGFISDDIVFQTAIQTVMNKASQKKEYVEELMSCLTYQFAAPNKI